MLRDICGLYYKHMTIINDYSNIVIYNRRMFIIQATGVSVTKHFIVTKFALKYAVFIANAYIWSVRLGAYPKSGAT